MTDHSGIFGEHWDQTGTETGTDRKTTPSVYAIRSGRFIKIGFATDVARRLNELQGGNPLKLEKPLDEPPINRR